MATAPVDSSTLSTARFPGVDPILARRATEDQALVRGRAQEGKAPAGKEPQAPPPLSAFGHFHLGVPDSLPFGPDQEASALVRIPGDGVRSVRGGVDLGHRPAWGLNILA